MSIKPLRDLSQRARVQLKGLLLLSEPHWPRAAGIGLNQEFISGRPAPIFDAVNPLLQESVGLDLQQVGCFSTADACLKLPANDLVDFLYAAQAYLVREANRTSGRTVPIAPVEFGRRALEILTSTDSSDTIDAGKDMNHVLAFISHSSRDKELAKALVDCLEACIQFIGAESAIRCTSVEGHQLDPGDHAGEVLRQNLEQCKVVLGLLTKEGLKSSFVTMELGAAWALKKRTCALLTRDVAFSRIPGPLRERHAIKVESAEQMTQLMESIAKETGLQMRSATKVAAEVNQFVAKAARLAGKPTG
ncbi:toll/interleukin-1 receptor domain-containing protein [Polyangium spumosum]|nr:toll/interleukin-1 receptor domain-containing protein [Polyangium spumosum]